MYARCITMATKHSMIMKMTNSASLREIFLLSAKKTELPMGAGPYKFVKFENKIVYFEANENYWQGVPKTKNIQFRQVADSDKVTGVQQGTLDIADPPGSKQVVEQVQEINGNGDVTGL